MTDASQTRQGVSVTVRGLRKGFGGVPVLKGIDLAVKPGEIFVVMGPSGSGKSVLLKHLIGLESPDAGEIRINDESIESDGVMDRYRMAMVFQSGALLNSLTVAENVGLYLEEHQLATPEVIARTVSEKLALVGLEGQEQRYPSDLSGGMKKRVAIARALVTEPQLLLYDEPTSELDPLMAVVIGDEIFELNRRIQVTSVVVTHDRELAFGIADRVAIMSEGEILLIGPPDEIRASQHPLIREFLSASFRHNQHRNSRP